MEFGKSVDQNQGVANPVKLCHTPFYLKNIKYGLLSTRFYD
jgi:hypothetical protein